MWTVYDHPRDFPDTYVARRSLIRAGVTEMTDEVIVGPDLKEIRRSLRRLGLVPLARFDADDPVIIETWI